MASSFFSVKPQGLAHAAKQMANFSERRIAATLATAMSRTAVKVKAELVQEMQKVFDKPTQYTLGSLYVKPATAQTMSARVWFKDKGTKGARPSAEYLLHEVEGGARVLKPFERALQALGALPSGYFLVPADGGPRDAFGNVPAAVVKTVLTQLRANPVDVKAQKKAKSSISKSGRKVVAIVPGTEAAKHLAPGIYIKDLTSSSKARLLFAYVKSVSYKRKLDFYGVSNRVSAAEFPKEIDRAIKESLARMAGKGRP